MNDPTLPLPGLSPVSGKVDRRQFSTVACCPPMAACCCCARSKQRLGVVERFAACIRDPRNQGERAAIWPRNMRDTAQTRNFGWVSNVEKYKELILPSLQETRTVVTLAAREACRISRFGCAIGRHHHGQEGARATSIRNFLTDGKIGRRFQDLRVIGIKTVEAGVPSAKLFRPVRGVR